MSIIQLIRGHYIIQLKYWGVSYGSCSVYNYSSLRLDSIHCTHVWNWICDQWMDTQLSQTSFFGSDLFLTRGKNTVSHTCQQSVLDETYRYVSTVSGIGKHLADSQDTQYVRRWTSRFLLHAFVTVVLEQFFKNSRNQTEICQHWTLDRM